MSKIYLPTEYLNKPCYVINNGYIRVYETTNQNYSNTVYDVYINQDYMVKRGTASYASSTQCDHVNEYTDNFYYRTDIDKVLIIFLILAFVIVWSPFKILLRFFKRFL